MADKIATIVLYISIVADVVVALCYCADKRWFAAGYWLAAAVIVFCAMKAFK